MDISEKTNPIVEIKTQIDGQEECEVEIIPLFNPIDSESSNDISILDQRLQELEIALEDKDKKIQRLESKADGLDYALAGACGVLTGILDALFVGEFSLEDAHQWGTDECNNFVMSFANKAVAKDSLFEKNYKFESLSKAIEYLERKYTVNYDVANTVMGGGDHHLYDFAHHPSLLGLIVSIVSQLSGKTYGWNTKENQFAWVNVTHSNAHIEGTTILKNSFRLLPIGAAI